MNKNNRKGFTLAELLIVVSIIAVLVAISIPIFHAQLRKARLAANQANGRAAFSAAEAAYLENMEKFGTSKPNGANGNSGTVTYTYFPAVGKGILNFRYTLGDNRWIRDSGGKIYQDTDVSHWTVDTEVSDSKKLGDQIAKIWTIHMNPDNGEIVGYYCAFPKNTNDDYQKVLKSFADGTESTYEQK